MNNTKIEKEFQKSCQEELGYVSAIFMSLGDNKSKDIIMPTNELLESADRFGLYLFTALNGQKQTFEKEIINFITDQRMKKYSTDLIIKHLIDGIKADEIIAVPYKEQRKRKYLVKPL